MKIERYWAGPWEIGKEFHQSLIVSPERIALSFPSGTLEVEEHGFRYSSAKLAAGQPAIVAIGGSTTFGHYCSRRDSWPDQLEVITGRTIINCGQPKADLWMSFQNLLHFARINENVGIAKVITYDGVNQNAGFNQFVRNASSYSPEHTNYGQLDRMMEVFKLTTTTSFNRYQFLLFLFGIRYREILLRKIEAGRKVCSFPKNPLEYFAISEAELYCATIRVMRSFVEHSLSSQLMVFLQPTLFDYFPPSREDRSRALYLKLLYDAILEIDKSIFDLRAVSTLAPDDFIDWAHLTPGGNLKIAMELSTRC